MRRGLFSLVFSFSMSLPLFSSSASSFPPTSSKLSVLWGNKASDNDLLPGLAFTSVYKGSAVDGDWGKSAADSEDVLAAAQGVALCWNSNLLGESIDEARALLALPRGFLHVCTSNIGGG